MKKYYNIVQYCTIFYNKCINYKSDLVLAKGLSIMFLKIEVSPFWSPPLAISTVPINDEPWFVGKEEDKLNNESFSSLGQRGGWLINKTGSYGLIPAIYLNNVPPLVK